MTSSSESSGKNASPRLTNHNASILGKKHNTVIVKSMIACTILWRYLLKAMLPYLSHLLRLPLHTLHLRAATIHTLLQSFGDRGTTSKLGNAASPHSKQSCRTPRLRKRHKKASSAWNLCARQLRVELLVILNFAISKSSWKNGRAVELSLVGVCDEATRVKMHK
jgi:hypothetical protein